MFSQTISVDNTIPASNLVDLLINNSCTEITNPTLSSNLAVGYFNQNGSSFPLTEGVIIRSGNILDSQGIYTGANMGSTTSGGGIDPFLQNLSNTSSGTNDPIVDLAYLEFEFTTVSNSFSFDFLFASNEYGAFQCLSNDIFAFELTNITTGTTTNLAVIPNTSNPVTVKNIKDAAHNGTCSSTNPTLFDVYNVDNPAASSLNMRGHTVVLTATSAIIPDNPYRLKLVIADFFSTNFDSAVFISGGSFNTDFSLGSDQTICAGDSFTLNTNLDNTYSFQWFLNSFPIAGATNSTYDVTQPGTYSVEITKGTCIITDTIVFNDLLVNSPNDLATCDSGGATNTYNLALNDEVVLGIDSTIFDVFYFESPADITANNFILPADLTNYQGIDGQTIYIKILNTSTGNYCDAVYTFNLIETANIVAGTNITEGVCQDAGTYDLSLNDVDVINGQTGTYNITYYNNQTDATSGNNPISSSAPIPVGPTTVTYWFRIEDAANPLCFDVTSIDITIHPLPIVDTIPNAQECTSYVLPVITNGTYYLLPGGPTTPGQVQYNAGDLIDLGGTYYIFAGPDANGCTNESSFELYFVDEYVPTLDNCGEFVVPSPPYGIGEFYTDFGGPTGTGTLIPTGTTYTNNTQSSIIETIYYYAEVPLGTPCRDERFDINIHPIPLLDAPADETRCNSYTLPALTNGMYYSGPGGTGVNYPVGHNVTTSETIYVYNTSTYIDVAGNPQICDNQNPFVVNIIDPNIFGNVFACETYTLPTLTFGNYYDAPNGGGMQIDPAIEITNSQTVYFYANVTDASNCAAFLNYNITIYPQVIVDTLDDGNYCGEYILPQFTPSNGSYFALSGGPSNGGQSPIPGGSTIDLTGSFPPGTYYIYNEIVHDNGDGTFTTCFNEDPFNVTINPFPGLDQAINRIECLAYSLPTPTIGEYYTEPDGPNGIGVIVDPSTVYTTTETFYLYYVDPVSDCRIDKEFQRIFKGINLPNFPNIEACNSYTLPALNNPTPNPEAINWVRYYTLPGGPNTAGQVELFQGQVYNTINTTETVYVYGINQDGHFTDCSEEKSFTITILETPVLPNYAALNNRNYCGTYTLPVLPSGNYTVNYYSASGGNPADIINPTNYTYTNSNTNPETHNVWIYAYNTIDNDPICFDEETFQFTVYPLLDLTITGGIICVDANDPSVTLTPLLLDSGLSSADFTVEWYLNGTLMGTGQTYLASTAGTYDVVTIKVLAENAPDCNYNPTTVLVEQSSSAIATVSVSEPFDNVAVITVNIDNGIGVYIFQLDDGEFQTSNQFTNVSSGEHIITVRDIFGYCGDFILNATVINYPRYFTPNGDAINETWNIFDLAVDHPESIISIFDRYGKLIKQISPTGTGWDGTYIGKKLPSTDYWFNVNYIYEGQEKIFRAHFSLIR